MKVNKIGGQLTIHSKVKSPPRQTRLETQFYSPLKTPDHSNKNIENRTRNEAKYLESDKSCDLNSITDETIIIPFS